MAATTMLRMLFVGIFLDFTSSATPLDPILQDRANGSVTVLRSVNFIQQSGIFDSSESDTLRLIAFVETRDGTNQGTFREGYNGGIWAVDKEAFISTKNTQLYPKLSEKLELITQNLNIHWLYVEWADLRKPLYSALAAQLVLFNEASLLSPPSIQFQVKQDGPAVKNLVTKSIARRALDNSANEFYVGFTKNRGASNTHHLFVTTTETSPVTFTVTATNFSFAGEVSIGSSTVMVDITANLTALSRGQGNKGIYVKAEGEKNIRVYGLNYSPHSADAFLALPCHNLLVDEYEYYAVSYSSRDTILIVACANNTQVSTPSANFVLNRQETYLIHLNDATGYRVTSSNPIALFSNDACSKTPEKTSICEHLTEQLPPTATWGKNFLVASLLGGRSSKLRIVAASASTFIVMNCTTFTQQKSIYIATAGSWKEIEMDQLSFCYIESSQPILLVQFSIGSDGAAGNPLMSVIPSENQYSNNYVIEAFDLQYRSYVTLYVSTGHFQPYYILLDNAQLHAEWIAVYCSIKTVCGYIARSFLSPGTHRILHQSQNARLGVSVYGFVSAASYGYPGGLQLTPIQMPLISFEDNKQYASEGVGCLRINITRSGNTASWATVLVATDNPRGSARALQDYYPIAKVVEFQANETLKRISVTLINNHDIPEPNEILELYMLPGPGVHLSPFSRAVVVIEDVMEQSSGLSAGGITGIILGIIIAIIAIALGLYFVLVIGKKWGWYSHDDSTTDTTSSGCSTSYTSSITEKGEDIDSEDTGRNAWSHSWGRQKRGRHFRSHPNRVNRPDRVCDRENQPVILWNGPVNYLDRGSHPDGDGENDGKIDAGRKDSKRKNFKRYGPKRDGKKDSQRGSRPNSPSSLGSNPWSGPDDPNEVSHPDGDGENDGKIDAGGPDDPNEVSPPDEGSNPWSGPDDPNEVSRPDNERSNPLSDPDEVSHPNGDGENDGKIDAGGPDDPNKVGPPDEGSNPWSGPDDPNEVSPPDEGSNPLSDPDEVSHPDEDGENDGKIDAGRKNSKRNGRKCSKRDGKKDSKRGSRPSSPDPSCEGSNPWSGPDDPNEVSYPDEGNNPFLSYPDEVNHPGGDREKNGKKDIIGRKDSKRDVKRDERKMGKEGVDGVLLVKEVIVLMEEVTLVETEKRDE